MEIDFGLVFQLKVDPGLWFISQLSDAKKMTDSAKIPLPNRWINWIMGFRFLKLCTEKPGYTKLINQSEAKSDFREINGTSNIPGL